MGGGATIVELAGSARPRARLFCFHHAGGGASVFRPWRRLLPDDIDLCLIQLAGRENRFLEEPHPSLEAAIDDVERSASGLLDAPYFFFGHSMGAVIAFAVAGRLGDRGPRQLFVSAVHPPHVPQRLARISGLDDDAFVLALQQRTNGLPRELLVDREALSPFLKLLKADFSAVERYIGIPYPLDCPIVALGGTEDPVIDPATLARWDALTRCEFSLRLFEGDHFYLAKNPTALIAFLLEQIGKSIDAPASA